MAFALTIDPLLTAADVTALLSVKDQQTAIIVANAIAAKFKRYSGRVQINYDADTDIVEELVPYGGPKLYLHAPVVLGVGGTLVAEVYNGGDVLYTYTEADGDLFFFSNDVESGIVLPQGVWPSASSGLMVRVTYKGGWQSVPGDVIQGAIMQARVDLQRMNGDVGMNSRGAQGESTSYQTVGIVREVLDLWNPYRVVA